MIRFGVEQDAKDEPLEFVGNIWRIGTLDKRAFICPGPLWNVVLWENCMAGSRQGDGLSHMNWVAQP